MARVLLYNFTDEAKRKKIKAILFRFAVPSREIPPACQGLTLGALLEGAESGETGAEEPPFDGEMIVMHDLTARQFNGLLDEMKRQGIRVPMKAVVTEHNIGWTSARLYREISAEREALEGRTAPAEKRTGER